MYSLEVCINKLPTLIHCLTFILTNQINVCRVRLSVKHEIFSIYSYFLCLFRTINYLVLNTQNNLKSKPAHSLYWSKYLVQVRNFIEHFRFITFTFHLQCPCLCFQTYVHDTRKRPMSAKDIKTIKYYL